MLILEIPIVVDILLIVLGLILGIVGLVFFLQSKKNQKSIEASKAEAEKIIEAAEVDAEKKKKDSINEAKQEIAELKQLAENDIK